ncbi:MAG: hypothetical protein MUF58_15790 [Arcicella sp.]|jgi:hypothetical protein|nr:hypothetical protein [Arcicella sp.]
MQEVFKKFNNSLLSKENMKEIKGGDSKEIDPLCVLTVAACWRSGSQYNAKDNGSGGWKCC